METVDATIVFLSRFTTLIGNTNAGSTFDFTTLPLDVSQYTGAQFQVWRGPMTGGTFKLFLEESLDAQTWVLGPNTPVGFDMNNEDMKFFSYSFRLRWFRLRVQLAGAASPTVTCWAEGLLRGGGSGAWPSPVPTGGTASGVAGALGRHAPPGYHNPLQMIDEAAMAKLRAEMKAKMADSDQAVSIADSPFAQAVADKTAALQKAVASR